MNLRQFQIYFSFLYVFTRVEQSREQLLKIFFNLLGKIYLFDKYWLISEGIFNLVPLLKKCTKSLFFNFSLYAEKFKNT